MQPLRYKLWIASYADLALFSGDPSVLTYHKEGSNLSRWYCYSNISLAFTMYENIIMI